MADRVSPGSPEKAMSKVTYVTLEERERTLLAMRASELGLSASVYIGKLICRDADESGLSRYFDAVRSREEVRHGE